METKQIDLSKRVFVLAVVIVVGLIGLWTVTSINSLMAWIWGYGPREISVSAEGKAIAVPDIALVRVGVQTEGPKVDKVVAENNTKMNDILAALKGLGIAEKDLQTTNYSLNPQYDYLESGRRIFRNYTLNQEVAVKVRDFAKIGDVLENVSSKGGNLIGDLRFSIDDQTKIKALAMQDGISKAKEKAQALSKASGIKLKKLVNVYEDSSLNPYYGYGGDMVKSVALEAAPAPQIQAGEQEIKINVTLTYRIK